MSRKLIYRFTYDKKGSFVGVFFVIINANDYWDINCFGALFWELCERSSVAGLPTEPAKV